MKLSIKRIKKFFKLKEHGGEFIKYYFLKDKEKLEYLKNFYDKKYPKPSSYEKHYETHMYKFNSFTSI